MKLTIETHPWEYFPKNSKIEKLIIGSFPPNKMVFEYGKEVVYQNKIKSFITKETKRYDFFYGSSQNQFWNLFFNSLNQTNLCDNTKELKDWLIKNNWGVTDLIYKTTRKKDSPNDSDLVPIEWNVFNIKSILNSNKINSIFFTSKWVQKHFERLFKDEDYKFIKKFILISPSPSGLRVFPNEVLKELPKNKNESNSEYRLRYYNYVLNT
jgi:G:T/U-mismatch repair DNA glycosylase